MVDLSPTLSALGVAPTTPSSASPRLSLAVINTSRDERRLAAIVGALSLAVFLLAVPFAKVQLARVDAFIPIYQSILVVNELITAFLLFGQFAFSRSRGLLPLAGGYLFTAILAAIHMATFPGLF